MSEPKGWLRKRTEDLREDVLYQDCEHCDEHGKGFV